MQFYGSLKQASHIMVDNVALKSSKYRLHNISSILRPRQPPSITLIEVKVLVPGAATKANNGFVRFMNLEDTGSMAS